MMNDYHPAQALGRFLQGAPSSSPSKATEPLPPLRRPLTQQVQQVVEEVVTSAQRAQEAEPETVSQVEQEADLGSQAGQDEAPIVAEQQEGAAATSRPVSAPPLGSEAAQVLQLLRAGEWRLGGRYEINLFVLSHLLWDDGAGELVGRAGELARRLDDQGLAEVLSADDTRAGLTCLRLTDDGRSLADQALAPL